MEFLLGLITGYLFTWPAIAVLCVLGILFEHNDGRGMAVFLALVALVSSYFTFNLSLQTVAIIVAVYLAIGVAWSIHRYSRHVRSEVSKMHSKNLTDKERMYFVKDLHPLQMVDTLVAWIIIWPFSAIEHLISDIIDAIQMLVTKIFRGVYVRIWESATKGLNVELDPK